MKFELDHMDLLALARGYEASAEWNKQSAKEREGTDGAAFWQSKAANATEQARRWRLTWEIKCGLVLPVELSDDEPCEDLAA